MTGKPYASYHAGKAFGIRCPECGEAMRKVSGTRPQKGFISRQRRCECGHRLRTHERPATEIAVRRWMKVGRFEVQV